MTEEFIQEAADVLAELIEYANRGVPEAIFFLYGKHGKSLCATIELPYSEMWELVYNGNFDDDEISPYGNVTWKN